MFAGWIPWKWIVCGCVAAVREPDAQESALGHPDDRARHGAVVRPGGERDALRDLDLRVDGDELVLGHARSPEPAGRGARRGHSGLPAPGPLRRSSRRGPLPRGRGPRRCVASGSAPWAPLGQRQLHERDGGQRRRRGDQELAPRDSEISPCLKSMLTAAAVASARRRPHGRCRAIVYACRWRRTATIVRIWSDYI